MLLEAFGKGEPPARGGEAPCHDLLSPLRLSPHGAGPGVAGGSPPTASGHPTSSWGESSRRRSHTQAYACCKTGSDGISSIHSTGRPPLTRSEEHTSELQSLRHLVCRLLLEKKKKITQTNDNNATLSIHEQENSDQKLTNKPP